MLQSKINVQLKYCSIRMKNVFIGKHVHRHIRGAVECFWGYINIYNIHIHKLHLWSSVICFYCYFIETNQSYESMTYIMLNYVIMVFIIYANFFL